LVSIASGQEKYRELNDAKQINTEAIRQTAYDPKLKGNGLISINKLIQLIWLCSKRPIFSIKDQLTLYLNDTIGKFMFLF
jgi:hypothetical protein